MIHRFIIAIGTNFRQIDNIEKVKFILNKSFSNVVFTAAIWTEPIGKNLSKNKFLNMLAKCESEQTKVAIENTLKGIERLCGNRSELRKEGVIVMDIDLLLFDQWRLHETDWQRDYIKELIKQI